MSQLDFSFSQYGFGSVASEGEAVFHSSLTNPLETGNTFARKKTGIGTSNIYKSYRAVLVGNSSGDVSPTTVSNFFTDETRYSLRCWVRPEANSAGNKLTKAGIYSKVAAAYSISHLSSYHMLIDSDDSSLIFCGTSYSNPLGDTHYGKWTLLRLDVSPIYNEAGTSVEADHIEGFVGTYSSGSVTWTSVAEKVAEVGTADYITPASSLYFGYGFYSTTSTALETVYFDNFELLYDTSYTIS